MSAMRRRSFLKAMGAGVAGGLASGPLMRALADCSNASSEFFILIHASGGWDVTLWADPRNEFSKHIDPATLATIDPTGLDGWKDLALAGNGGTSFQLQKAGQNVFGPAMGSLLDLADRLCIVNGIWMNTVSHPDGTYFSSTGRHLAGGHPAAASIDTMLSNEFGLAQLLPTVSMRYPSTFIGRNLDQKVLPVRVSDISGVAESLSRSADYDTPETRAGVNQLLAAEATELGLRADDPGVYNGFSLQSQALTQMVTPASLALFDANKLQSAHKFNFGNYNERDGLIKASFAIEAIRTRVLRSLAFSVGNFDTHGASYRQHALTLQSLFNVLATMLKEMDVTTFADSKEKLSDHVHILVTSDFCRTPTINPGRGRDHFPNNSTLIISPRFKGGTVFGSTDDQLLPNAVDGFEGGARQPAPPDVLATFLSAFCIDPRKYMRDGEVIKAILK